MSVIDFALKRRDECSEAQENGDTLYWAAYLDGAKAQLRESNKLDALEWTPEGQGKPEAGEDVLLCFETGIVAGGFITENGTWCSYVNGEFYTDCDSAPAFWAKYPKLPKNLTLYKEKSDI